MDGITVARAAELTGMTPGQVSNAIFYGVIEPEYRVGEGSGDFSLLGDRNIRELHLVRRLKNTGVKNEMIKNILNLIKENSLFWWREEDSYVVVNGKEEWFVTTNPFSRSNQKLIRESGIALLVKL